MYELKTSKEIFVQELQIIFLSPSDIILSGTKNSKRNRLSVHLKVSTYRMEYSHVLMSILVRFTCDQIFRTGKCAPDLKSLSI